MKLVFSSLAVAELEIILHYTATRNPAAAARVAARFDDVLDRIAQYPDGAQELAQRPSVRRSFAILTSFITSEWKMR